MAHDDLWRLDATAQAALVRAGQVSPVELVRHAIDRIERLNPRINAVITTLYDVALRQARDAAPGAAPFAGVPMLLKDATQEVEGTPYYLGTKVLRDIGYRSARTTETARRLRAAGFIFMGKTNVPELSAGITTEPAAFGPTCNPWALDRSAGGSSGGSAAAVAAGMSAIAHGGDATGSLRYPAACCGVVTLKPSRGRMPHATPAGQPDALGVWCDFVLTRSVRDLAGVLDAVGGAPPGAAFTAPRPACPYVEELRAPVRPLRVGLLKRDAMAGLPVDPECALAVERTGRALATLGYYVEESHPPAMEGVYAGLMGDLAIVGLLARGAQHRWLERVIGRPLRSDDLEGEIITPEQLAAVTPKRALRAEASLAAAMARIPPWWDDGHDLLITPTLRQPAWPLGSTGGALDAGVFPPPFSFTGQPAMSLPLHWTPTGLPVGVQLVAAHGRDGLLFNVAWQLEQAMPWADRWPEIGTS